MVKLLKVKEVAKYLSMTEQAVYQLVHRNRIPVVRIGKSLRFDIDEINNWISRQSC